MNGYRLIEKGQELRNAIPALCYLKKKCFPETPFRRL